MINIHYTSANKNEIQRNISSSIGGYISINKFQSGELNNIFQDFSRIKNGNKNKYCLLAIQNDSVQKTNVDIYTSIENDLGLYTIKTSVVSPALSGSDYIFERLDKNTNKPIYSDFQLNNSTNKIIIHTFASNEIIGLWLCLEPKNDLINTEIDFEQIINENTNEFNISQKFAEFEFNIVIDF